MQVTSDPDPYGSTFKLINNIRKNAKKVLLIVISLKSYCITKNGNINPNVGTNGGQLQQTFKKVMCYKI